jgi:hypothetical protein
MTSFKFQLYDKTEQVGGVRFVALPDDDQAQAYADATLVDSDFARVEVWDGPRLAYRVGS